MTYVKPTISIDTGLAEGVYAASGCYMDIYAAIEQRIEHEKKYVIRINGKHSADHTSDKQVLTVTFNQNVTYLWAEADLIGGNGTPTLALRANRWQNANDNINLSLQVSAETGLDIINTSISD